MYMSSTWMKSIARLFAPRPRLAEAPPLPMGRADVADSGARVMLVREAIGRACEAVALAEEVARTAPPARREDLADAIHAGRNMIGALGAVVVDDLRAAGGAL